MGDILSVLDEDGDPTGGHYDLMAAFRYLGVSYKKAQPNYVEPENSLANKDWSFGG
jgi:hypothetical protein